MRRTDRICALIRKQMGNSGDSLMKLRNRIVSSVFGLKDLGTLSNIDLNRPASTFKIGDRIGIFTLLHLSEHQIIVACSTAAAVLLTEKQGCVSTHDYSDFEPQNETPKGLFSSFGFRFDQMINQSIKHEQKKNPSTHRI